VLNAVLFDLDDTLFDHRHSSREALSVLQQAYPRDLGSVAMDELEVVNLEILNMVHLEVLAGTLTPDEARVKRFGLLLRTYGLEPSLKELDDVATIYRSSYQLSRRATPGAIHLLHVLRNRGLRTAIVTNNLVDEQMDKLQHCKLLELIDCIVISEEAGYVKPDVRIFERALTRLECDPHEAVMIGDSWENDIIGARAAGIPAIWYNCYSMELPDRSVPEIRSLEDSNVILRLLLPQQV
jgi:HAD superfamily hydrolase (TIGR01549 family)